MVGRGQKHYIESLVVWWVVVVVVVVGVNGPKRGVGCLPLSTSSRWIVDEATGGRVKLACVNWAAHLTPMLAEGLHARPLSCIARTIAAWGFNCVRLTWATYMFTDTALASQTVAQTFAALKLEGALAGIALHNPGFVNLTTVDALRAVARGLGEQGLMVVLDNQMSKPGWCCGERDGNGFFGDRDFDPGLWLQGLRAVASAFTDNEHVVGMSLRNELRGRRQNVEDWYTYMQRGAEAISQENPALLVIHGGLSYAQDLRFLRSRPLAYGAGLRRKVVYEVHRYSFTNGDSYAKAEALDKKCAAVAAQVMGAAGFVAGGAPPDEGLTGPLFVSEFGVDMTGARLNDARFLPCFSAFLAGGDFEWALWALQGSYYLRQGTTDHDESYGLMNHAWNAPRNASLLRRLQALQPPLVQDLNFPSTQETQVIFHPMTGLCINTVSMDALTLGPCTSDFTWSFKSEDMIKLDGTHMVILAQGQDAAALLKVPNEGVEGSVWKNNFTSTGMQIATHIGNETLCLDGNSPPSLYTRSCICMNHSQCEDLSGQWFKFVNISNPHSSKVISSL